MNALLPCLVRYFACSHSGPSKLIPTRKLFSLKKQIFLFNIRSDSTTEEGQSAPSSEAKAYFDSFGFPVVSLDVREELDGAGFSDEERKELALAPSKLSELIKTAYKALGLITFFTTGEDETRAWTIEQGSLAPQAAGVIHSDFEEKFIRADIIQWQVLLSTSGWADARTKGLIQTVGKDYVMRDGDVMEFKHG